MENKKWVILCIIGGVLMILSGTIGTIGFYETIFTYLATWVPQIAPVISIILQIFTWIALGGGAAVILGAIICGRGDYPLGKFIIGLGAGMGLLGLIISLITSIYAGTFVADLSAIGIDIGNGSYGFVGVILTIVARMNLKEA
ncbi:MAG: hypothetical protein ACFFCM_09080 [Promethearchaeota archaeon]